MSEQRQPPGSSEPERELSPELSEFLVDLSVGVHRYAMYPPGHPALDPAVASILSRLTDLFVDRRTLNIGVARSQLVVDGVSTAAKHPVQSDLARRLHGHQIGALVLEYGVRAPELRGLLETLAEEDAPDRKPLGLRPRAEIPTWEHVTIYPVGYDHLAIKGGVAEADSDRATQLWLGLARAALAGGTHAPESAPDGRMIARSIEEHRHEEAYDQAIVHHLLQLTGELQDPAAGARSIRGELDELIREMDPATLTRLVQLGGDVSKRQRLVLDASRSLAVDSVIKVLQSAAGASGQTISHSMSRLLGKLATHAGRGPRRVRERSAAALRQNVSELVRGWSLDDPNPDGYTSLLDAMAHSAPLFQIRLERERDERSGSRRIVEMALEIDAFGPTVKRAVVDLVDRGEAGRLVSLIEGAPEGSQLGERIGDFLTDPRRVRRILAAGDTDAHTLQKLVDRMGPRAVSIFVDILAECASLPLRRRILEVLLRLDEEAVGRAAVERMRGGDWLEVHNMLVLLKRLEAVPPELDLHRWLAHDDERVRREVLPLALRAPATRDRAITQALADPDEEVVRMGLLNLRGGVPEVLEPTVVSRVLKADRSDEIRALAARCLRDSPSGLARDALMGLVTAGRTLFGRPKLAERSMAVISALEVLQRSWRDDEEVAEVLELATRSRDPLIRRAVGVL